MRHVVADQALCGCTAAGGIRAAWAAAVQFGFYAAASIQFDAARRLIADRRVGNWRRVCYGVSGLANMQLERLWWVGGIDLAQYAWVVRSAAGRPAWRQSLVFLLLNMCGGSMRDEENRWLAERAGCGDAYDAIYQQRAAAGEDVHGEADFWRRWEAIPYWMRGCGTGRVARGLDVAGVDIDAQMLATAMRAAPVVPARRRRLEVQSA